jgi:uncharacterized protein YjbI with pentapeptide repeats
MKYQVANIPNKLWIFSIVCLALIITALGFILYDINNDDCIAACLFGKDNEEKRGKLITLALSVIGGFCVIWGLLINAQRVSEQTRQNDIAENNNSKNIFSNAVKHLESDNQAIVVGGIYALHNIAKENDFDAKMVFEVFCTYIREKSYYIAIQTIIDILFKGNDYITYQHFIPDFSDAKLNNVDFSEAIINKGKFFRVKLNNCTFLNAKLFNCRFDYSEMTDCKFISTNLSKISFLSVPFVSCKFNTKTYIEQCSFEDKELINCIFSETHLTDCNFLRSSLRKCRFDGESKIENCTFNDTTSLIECYFYAKVEKTNFMNTTIESCKYLSTLSDCLFQSAHLLAKTKFSKKPVNCIFEDLYFDDSVRKLNTNSLNSYI